jgi:Zn-dependent protease with chaperone function
MSRLLLGCLLVIAAVWPYASAPASTIQFFSLAQDLDLGAAMAAEADRTLPLLRGNGVEAYIRTLGTRLAPSFAASGMRFQFRIVNSTNVNAVTFPGGKVYIERGLLEMVQNEDELAALLAHEMAHAALRHGTRQLSGQLLVQAPASVLAGLPTNEEWMDQLVRLGISLAPRASFLRYSSDQEAEANSTAIQTLLRANYSPYALLTILQKINEEAGTEARSLPPYSYNHPQGTDALRRVEGDITTRRVTPRPYRRGPEFRSFEATLARIPEPVISEPVAALDSELPNEYTHPANYYNLRFPQGWQVRPTGANGAMIAPPAGIFPTAAGDDLRTGVMFDIFEVPEPISLTQATNRLIVLLRQRNQELTVIPGAQSQTLMGSEPALRTVMIRNPRPTDSPRRPAEIVWIATRFYYDNLFYLVCVAPQDDFPELQLMFERIIQSVDLR